jgi:hypothetical protein
VATFYVARSEIITPLPWQTFALPFSAAEGLGGFLHTVLFKEMTTVSKAVEQGAGRLCIIKDHCPFA